MILLLLHLLLPIRIVFRLLLTWNDILSLTHGLLSLPVGRAARLADALLAAVGLAATAAVPAAARDLLRRMLKI
jgi:hypothetical protein